MSAYTLIETVVIVAIVGASAWTVLARLFPGLLARTLVALGRPSAPSPAGCDSGCSQCSGCASAPARKSGTRIESPVRFDRLP